MFEVDSRTTAGRKSNRKPEKAEWTVRLYLEKKIYIPRATMYLGLIDMVQRLHVLTTKTLHTLIQAKRHDDNSDQN